MQPIIYANAVFEALTGYGEAEILGRDCRFLQANDQDQAAKKQIRNALLDERPVRAVLRNYRKDGELFYNELFINPLFDENGIATHFIGCQNAVASPANATLCFQAGKLFGRLSAQEKEVFRRVASGRSNKEIAAELELSPRTVEKYRLNMQRKMQTNSLATPVRYAVALGIDIGTVKPL